MKQLHGPEIDAALDAAAAGPEKMAEDFGVCLSGFEARTRALVDAQIEELASGEGEALARAALVHAGEPDPPDELVRVIALRTAVGGAFSLGVHAGLELARHAGWAP